MTAPGGAVERAVAMHRDAAADGVPFRTRRAVAPEYPRPWPVVSGVPNEFDLRRPAPPVWLPVVLGLALIGWAALGCVVLMLWWPA